MKSGRFHWRFGVPGFAAVLMFVLTLPLAAQQVPSPQTAAQVPGPASGNTMTRAYVQAVGRMAYLWGWPLVNMYNRYQTIVKLPESGLLGGIAPAAYNRLAMLTDYMSPDMRAVTLPQSGRRLWHRVSSTGQDLYRPASSRLRRPFLALSSHRRPYGRDFATRQAMGHVLPRVFLLDTPEDHAAIQPLLSQMDFYPLAEFDGKTKTLLRQHERHHGFAVIAWPRNRLQRYQPSPLWPTPGCRVDPLV